MRFLPGLLSPETLTTASVTPNGAGKVGARETKQLTC